MKNSYVKAMQNAESDRGELQVNVTQEVGNRPVEGAEVSISYTGNPSDIIEEFRTDRSGNSPQISLPTPPLEYSMTPGGNQPYSEYTIHVRAEGFAAFTVSGTELLPGQRTVQPVKLQPETPQEAYENIVIPAHTLYGEYPEKIPEEEIKPLDESGEIVLSRVVIPEYVVVHDGPPGDTLAKDYYVRYRDYIKNVACSEIYATWPDETIRANVLAIMSFTLNRVYTEW